MRGTPDGVPDPELYPLEHFTQATDTVLRHYGRNLLQYCPTEGHLPFQETLAELAQPAIARPIV
jgi:DNA-binding transcriptional MocR family regulator